MPFNGTIEDMSAERGTAALAEGLRRIRIDVLIRYATDKQEPALLTCHPLR